MSNSLTTSDKKLSNPTLSNKKIHKESRRPRVHSYTEFLNWLYDDLEYIFDQLSKNKNIYHQAMISNSQQGENLINATICNSLDMAGWDAQHDPNINGHSDIVVTFPNTDYLWLGEGKIRRNKSSHYKGLKQLLHRYSTGRDNATAGGLLLYITQTNFTQKTIMDDWQQDIQQLDKQQSDIEDIPSDTIPISKAKDFTKCQKSSFAFYSQHTHPLSGLDYWVRHMSIDLRHQPKD